jgi:hypothetical protein
MTATRVPPIGRPVSTLLTVALALGIAGAGCGDPKVMGGAGAAGGSGINPGRAGSGGSSGSGTGGSSSNGGGGFTLPDAGSTAATDAVVSMPGAGMNNQCAAEAYDGKIVPLDLFFLVDISGSMGDMAGNRTKWVTVRDSLAAFLKDGRSAGLGVGLQFFPPPAKRCTSGSDCGFLSICEQRAVCAAPDMVSQSARTCNTGSATACFGTAPCTVVGQCARTGIYCGNMGQPCAGGMADDMCLPRPRICTDNPPNLCDVAGYSAPAVAFADLPANEPKLTTALMDIVPNGSTPTAPAVEGALNHLRMRAMADANRKPVLVLATDGLPQSCNPGNTIPAAAGHLSAAFMPPAGGASIPTYVIGVFAPTELVQAQMALTQLATAGGTGMPFVLTAGQDLGQRFIDTLNAIRGRALGCEFMIPTPKMGAIDYKKVNVRYNGPAGAEDLIYVGSADKCDPNRGGWYYDTDPTTTKPTRVRLCEATCNKVKNEQTARVELLFGCITKVD